MITREEENGWVTFPSDPMTVYAYRLVMEEDDGQEQDIVYSLELKHSTSLDRW
jgi:hypothetical protein